MATINIDEATKYDLKLYCKKQDITQGDFVKFALSYYRKSGINPSDPPESIKEELAKIEKRISQLIGFQKTFERNNLLPLLDALTKTEGKVNLHLSELPKKLEHALEGITLIGKATGKLEPLIGTTLQRLFDEFNRMQGDVKDNIYKQHKILNEKLDIILEYGAAVGLTGSCINDRFKKQNK